MDTLLRAISAADLPELWRRMYGDPDPAWKRWDAPYWPLEFVPEGVFVERARSRLDDSWRGIQLEGGLRGVVTRHWEDQPAGWLEVGIVIYDPACWGSGHGTRALREWTGLCFSETPAHSITLTSWSGNQRMLRAAGRLGYRECARIREVRLWAGQRWDSVKMQLLRAEWSAAGAPQRP